MSINRVILGGFTGKDARSSSRQNGKSMTKLSVATTKRYKDAQQQWQEQTAGFQGRWIKRQLV